MGEEASPPSLFQTGTIFLSLQLGFYLLNKLRLWGSHVAANEKYTPLETNPNNFKNPILSMILRGRDLVFFPRPGFDGR